MKIRIFDRILLTLYTIAIIALSVATFAIAWRLIPIDVVKQWIDAIYTVDVNIIILTVIGVIFLIISLKLLFSGAKKQEPKVALLRVTENGSIMISLSAIDTLVQKYVRRNPQVRDVKSQVLKSSGGVIINLKLSLMPDAEIPELAPNIQQNVKENIEKYTGIPVDAVQIHIESTGANPHARVN